MPYFEYVQNNSGGNFSFSEWEHTQIVIIEAVDGEHADERAKSFGLYFDGYGDCPCCGDRWYAAGFDPGDDVPSHYGDPVAEVFDVSPRWHNNWMGNNPDAYVHHLSGLIEAYKYGQGRVGVKK